MRRALLICLVAFLCAPAAAFGADGWWTFLRETNANSTLSWKWTYPPNTTQYSKSWRAGSGTTRNECRRGEGE